MRVQRPICSPQVSSQPDTYNDVPTDPKKEFVRNNVVCEGQGPLTCQPPGARQADISIPGDEKSSGTGFHSHFFKHFLIVSSSTFLPSPPPPLPKFTTNMAAKEVTAVLTRAGKH
ncbi:hypothetical protein E2C01_096650 [Portunus trituberculatus]|uniref:Uncharacterized protein n=1 Tax=Portunus trituberculatus TaxID=210409 RepID=A0A5B7K8T6_PORTR|nr:hypothetical protein [Portunus trituberculatus]